LSKSQTADSAPLSNERELLSRVRKGDSDAFGEIVHHYRERIYFAALRIVRNPDDARDLSQDAFVRAFERISQYDSRRPFYPWLYRIVRNLCLDEIRRHGPRRKCSLEELTEEKHLQFETPGLPSDDDSADVRDRIHAEQMARHLHTAIEELKPEFREIVMMKHLEHMSYKEIAEALEIPVGTVMSRLFHARKALAELMKAHRV